MIRRRPAEERGHAHYGWLDTRYTFSFADYHDPEHDGFRVLRVINEDRIAGGGGFGEHPHRDMEILTYMVAGALEHRDSMGNGSVIRAGELQRMTAGTGVTHSEINASATEPVHLLQIWLFPEQRGLEPGYEQREFSAEDKHNRLRLVAAPDGEDGALRVHQDARVFASVLDRGISVRHGLTPGRHAWVQVVRGSLDVNGARLGAGDGAAISDEQTLAISAGGEAELLLFDLP